MTDKFLIINADDFGASTGVNRGIVESHTHGVLTSTSLMVYGRAIAEAVAMSRDCPNLSIGLHWDVWGEDEREFDTHDRDAVRDEFHRQMDLFQGLMKRMPTHIDSHRHAHREGHLRQFFTDLVQPFGLPLRDCGPIRFVGGFYAQWEWKVTNLEYVSVEFLQNMLETEVQPGWTELSCHPGYVTADYQAVYLAEREAEVRTLVDPRIRETIDRLQINLVGFADFPSAAFSADPASSADRPGPRRRLPVTNVRRQADFS
jgi:predicted glycoside hydrolase/deacetylase ChbG (UPF0249 family)